MKRVTALLTALILLLLLCSCGQSPEVTATVTKNEKFGSANFSLSLEDFETAGFALGDSCDVTFGNGYALTDVPFYNGYYVKDADPVMVAYPGYSYVCVTYNNLGIWDTAELSEGETVTVTLREKGKYAPVQEAIGQEYSVFYEDYDSPVEFANFRPLTGGALRENFLYRGASPVDNSRGRAAYTDELLQETGIAFIVDLSDSQEDVAEYMADEAFSSPYAAELYEGGQMVFLDMGSAYRSEDYRQRVAEGFRAMLDAEGSVYIHCMEGKDRTGFVCLLLEALAGASYSEMQQDYMQTYANYYDVTADETPEKYDAIVSLYFDSFVSYLHGTDDLEILTEADYTEDAEAYLTAGGMTDTEVTALRELITE